LPVFFSYGGWQMICYVAPEVRDPQRTLPRAIVLGLLAVVAVYLAFNVALLRGLGLEAVAADPQFAGSLARAAAGETGERLVSAGMAISALGVCAVTIIGSPWLYVAMAREGLFFERFGRLHPRTGAPVLALAVQGLVTLAYLALTTLSWLVDSVVFVEWIFHGLVAWGLVRLRARADVPRPFRAPCFPLVPLVYLVTAVLIVCGTLWKAPWKLKGTGLAILLAGAVAYALWCWWSPPASASSRTSELPATRTDE
jgi:APA family basic amino acid/polyamine antiporter